ncbi:MAG: EamA family transporter [bacterium]
MLETIAGGGWLKPSLLALLFWGLWGFLTKLGAQKIPWQTMMIFFALCTLLLGIIAKPTQPRLDLWHGIGLAGGLAGALGFFYFYIAMARGSATTVIPLTSLYVAVASVLAFLLLSEPVTLRKILGIFAAIAAMVLLV